MRFSSDTFCVLTVDDKRHFRRALNRRSGHDDQPARMQDSLFIAFSQSEQL